MPLRDHFHPPLYPRHHWESFFSNWATRLADALTEKLPPEFTAEEHTRLPDGYYVHIFASGVGLMPVSAIELISPSDKGRAEERHAFAAKCAGYLQQQTSLIVIDIVTSQQANLHSDTMRLLNVDGAFEFPAGTNLYAVAYRPVLRQDRPEIDVWAVPCALGGPLPVMPLRLTGDLFVPVDFEATYQEACRRRRLPS